MRENVGESMDMKESYVCRDDPERMKLSQRRSVFGTRKRKIGLMMKTEGNNTSIQQSMLTEQREKDEKKKSERPAEGRRKN